MKNPSSLIVVISLPIISLLSAGHLVAQTPLTVTGIVLDSASRQPLPYVAVQIKGHPSGRSSADDGSFSISCFQHDTLVFTRLGYNPSIYAVQDEKLVRIELVENVKMLKDIVVYDKIIVPGVEQWKKTQKPQKPIKFQNSAQVAAPGILPTFGPGISIPFGGRDKTKKKRDELIQTETYRTTINSPEVKRQLMDLYSINEETYFRKLEAFNKENPDATKLTSRDEIITMLIQFFALKEP